MATEKKHCRNKSLWKIWNILFLLTLLNIFFQIRVWGKIHVGYFLIALIFTLVVSLTIINLPKARLNLKKALILSPPILLFAALGYTSVLAYNLYGYDINAFRYPVMIMSFTAGFYLFKFTYKDLEPLIKKFTAIFLTLFFARNLFLFDQTLTLLTQGRDYVKNSYLFIANGGHNIECTFLAFTTMLQTNRTLFWLTLSLAFLWSLIWGSRAGMLLSLLALIMHFLSGKKLSINRLALLIFGIVGVFVVMGLLYPFLPADNSIARFLNLEKELEYGRMGIGRLGFLFGAGPMLENNIFGYGAGNAVRIMQEYTGLTYRENNVHNIYLQYLLDGGIQSLIAFLMLAGLLVYFSIRDRLSFPPLRVALAYIIAGLIQFTGYDVIGWFFIGYAYAYMYYKYEPGPTHVRLDQ